MSKLKTAKSKKNSMKCQRFVAGRKLFRLLSWVALAAMIKIVVIALIVIDFTPGRFDELTVAVAQTADAQPNNAAPENNSAAGLSSNDTGQTVSEPEMGPPPPGMIVSLQEALQRREQAVTQREQDVAAMERQVDAKLASLQEMEGRMRQMLDKAESMQDQKLKHLIDVYSNMKAKQAATVLETLDESVAVKILAGMAGRQAGEVLSNVNPQKAAKLTESLTRMQLPPTEW